MRALCYTTIGALSRNRSQPKLVALREETLCAISRVVHLEIARFRYASEYSIRIAHLIRV